MKGISAQYSWQQIKRFEYIERQLLWERRLNAKPLMAYFGISRHQATKDVQSYVELAPHNIQAYDPKLKYYTPSPGFKPIFAKELPGDFVGSGLSDSTCFVERIHALGRRVLPGVLPIVMESIDSDSALDIIYASARSPDGKARRIWPRAIAYAANRLHIRAFCAENHEYRDFNVSRILDVPIKVRVPLPVSTDVAWELMLELILIPNENLTRDGQNLIITEFNLKGHEKPIQIRAALLQYFLQDNLLPYTADQLLEAKQNPWKFPLMVENLAAFEKWYF